MDTNDKIIEITQPEQEETEQLEDFASDVYVHRLKTPFEYEGRTVQELTFRMGSLTGKDIQTIANEMRLLGLPVAARSFDLDFQMRYAVRCCEEKITLDLLRALPAKDFNRICTRVQTFFVS